MPATSPRPSPSNFDDAGYRTGLFGKYFNNFWPNDIERNGMPVGWDVWHGFTGSNPDYYDYSWLDWNRGDTLDDSNFTDHSDANGNNVYSTNYAGRFADAFIDRAAAKGQPFFAYYAPFGPHGQYIPAPGDQQVTAPTNMGWKTPAYDETNVSDKPAYLREVPASRSTRSGRRTSRSVGTTRSAHSVRRPLGWRVRAVRTRQYGVRVHLGQWADVGRPPLRLQVGAV